MRESKTFIYDRNLDRLVIFNKVKDNEKIYGSVNIFNLIIDFTTNNRIANIEIINVSEYLRSLGIDPDILNKIEDSQIVLKQMRGGFLLTILLKYENKTINIPFSLPTEDKAVITV